LQDNTYEQMNSGITPALRHCMQQPHIKSGHQEPIGIVIADGGRGDSTPRFSAFVWGPVPEDIDDVREEVRELIAAS
jgi:hypothetical protein